MDKAIDYIALAIPVFFILIGIELLIDKLKKTHYYRFNDAITNLSCGIGQQIVGIFLKTVTAVGYVFLYDHARFFTFPGLNTGHSTGEVVITFTLLFIGVDHFYYWFHRLAHEISILWGSHIVHHQSEEYNLTVALRQAWLQGAFSWVFYLPLAVLGFDPAMFIVVGSFQTLYQFWIHTRAIDKLPAPIEYIFNTPSHHRVHHGVNPKYIDKNHGGTLIIFDRMFGTFQAEEEEVVYGITTQAKSWNPLWLNFEYWIDLFKEVGKARTIGDKVKMLVLKPGWKPDYLGGVSPIKEVTPETFHKYDTTIPSGLNYYILIQFVIVLLGTTLFLFTAEGLQLFWRSILAVLLIWMLVDLGGMFEKRRWTMFLEPLRIIASTAVVIALFMGNAQFSIVIGASITLMLVSLVWFLSYRRIFNTDLVTSRN